MDKIVGDYYIPRSRLNVVELELQEAKNKLAEIQKVAHDYIDAIEKDALIMAMRLMGEDENTFAPETLEVMRRWKKKCTVILGS